MAVRLEPQDEFLHEPGPESNFNESMYFNCFDPVQRVGGFFRLGNRPNEGYAEMTICLYLPDGRVGFMFARPRIGGNHAFDAGGMRFETVTPFEELRVAYDGPVALLADPLAMADPKRAFTESPSVACRVDLTILGRSAMFGGEPDESHERPGEEFAKAHYEQLLEGRGTIDLGDQGRCDVTGFGLRDHSWGPRFWQAPWYYRWLTANFGPDFGFMASRVARRDGAGTRGGFVWDGQTLHLCHDVQLSTGWQGEDAYHRSIEATLTARTGEWKVTGEVMSLIPLRNRREELVTRISEGMTRWTLADGRVGYGLSEYLDQIIDGAPVGLAE